MVRKLDITLLKKSLLSALAACLMTTLGCTVAAPNVSALTDLPSFAAKSTNPFLQENLGGIIYMSGQCLPNVTGFEFRMNNFTIWSQIPNSPPTPSSAEGEYLVGTPEYDVDCSDGTFNFYLFVSGALNNFDINGQSKNPGDPSTIELRAIGAELPTIVFKRPPPISFNITSNGNNGNIFSNYIENAEQIKLNIRMNDAFGKSTMLGSGDSRVVMITATDIDTVVSVATIAVYESDCATVATAADMTFEPGEDEIQLCIVPSAMTAGHKLHLDFSNSSMLTSSLEMLVKPSYSAMTYLGTYSPGSNFPPAFVKGATYSLKMGLGALNTNNYTRYVNGYMGDLKVDAYNSHVTLAPNGTDPECTASGSGAYSCTTTSTGKNFLMTLDASYPYDFVEMAVTATPNSGCGVLCYIYEGGINYTIPEYINTQNTFKVVSGSTTFSEPYFSLRNDSVIRKDNCSQIDVGLANSDGNVLPGVTGKTLTITVIGVNASQTHFYYNNNCSSAALSSTSVSYSPNDILLPIYVSSSQAESDGKITFHITDGTSTWDKSFYFKEDN